MTLSCFAQHGLLILKKRALNKLVIVYLAEPKSATFSASGKLGTSLYNHTITLMDPSNQILVSSNPSKIPLDHILSGATTRQAYYGAPKTFAQASDGGSHLVLISYPSIDFKHPVLIYS